MSENIFDIEYVIGETYYVFSDNRLTNQYMKHIATNSPSLDEALRRIKRIENRVISLSNYAKAGLQSSLIDDEILVQDENKRDFSNPNFYKIDSYFNDNQTDDFATHLSNNAKQSELQSIIRQCEAIRLGSIKMAKMVSNYYFTLNLEKAKMELATKRNIIKGSDKEISFTNIPRTISM